jgi:hypothetical protein
MASLSSYGRASLAFASIADLSRRSAQREGGSGNAAKADI